MNEFASQALGQPLTRGAARPAAPELPSASSIERQRLQYLLSVSPAIIYTTKASGDFRCTFVSENLCSIMGYSPTEMTTDPKCWPDHLHPDDEQRVLREVRPLIDQGAG